MDQATIIKAVILFFAPLFIYACSDLLIELFAAPDDLAPQGAMVLAGLIVIISFLICWAFAITIILKSYREKR